MNRRQIERAERLVESMRVERDRRAELALAEAQGWERPKSLATPRSYVFTDEQMMIALRSLEKNGQ